MSSDLELLELAAKAAGIPIVPCTCGNPRWPFKHDEAKSGKRGHWNPLEDDGDALRLAVKLRLEIQVFDETVSVNWPLNSIAARCIPDHYAATRRAIVRAAAEIGRTMREGGAA